MAAAPAAQPRRSALRLARPIQGFSSVHGSHWHSGNGVSASTPCASGTDLDETGGVSARMSRNSFASLACAAHVARRSAHLHLQPGSSCKCKDLAPSRIPGTIFSCSAFSLGWKKGSGPGALAKCWKTSTATVSPPDSPAQKTHTQNTRRLSISFHFAQVLWRTRRPGPSAPAKNANDTEDPRSPTQEREPGDVASVKSGVDGSANMGINRSKTPK